MSDEWIDDDDPKVRALCGYALRAHVRYQDGRYSLAPALVFADADYELGDGTCGLHSDGKQANEPAIVYTRVDALIDANDRIKELEAEIASLRATLTVLDDTPSITVADHVEQCVFLGAHLPNAAAIRRGDE